MITLNQKNLIDALKKYNFDPQIQDETNQIYLIFKHEKREFPLFIRTLDEGELLQLLTFIPCMMKPEQQADVSRFLHMINKELDVPGFCLDESTSTVFYRLVIATPDNELSETIFEAFLNTSQMVTRTFSPAIEAIASGAMPLAEVLKKAQAAEAKK